MSAGLQHALVLSDDIDATRDFYRDVVGLRAGPRPALEFPGYWLYGAGATSACLHIAARGPYLAHAAALGLEAGGDAADGDPAVDHLAFGADDHEAALARIQAAGLTPVRNAVPGGPRQLFVHDPSGVRVEINVA